VVDIFSDPGMMLMHQTPISTRRRVNGLALHDPERSKAVRKVEKLGEEGWRWCQFRKIIGP